MTAAPRPSAAEARQCWIRALEATAAITREPLRTFPVVIEEGGQRFGDAPALLSEEQSFTHGELARRCRRYARWGLQQALARGEVVALLMENCPEYLAAWAGLTRLGVVVALLNTNLRADALLHAIRVAAPRALILGAPLWDELAPFLRERRPGLRLWRAGPDAAAARDGAGLDAQLEQAGDAPLSGEQCALPRTADRALLIYTSGTTGLPKAANVSHLRLMHWSHWFAGMAQTGPADRFYDCLPMYHSVGGIVATGAALVTGGSVVVRRRFSARNFWADVARWECTAFQYIGELCRILVSQPADPLETSHGLRIACGNGMARDVWERFQERFRVPRILEFYAATEANFSLYNCEAMPGSLGRVPPFLAHRFAPALVRLDAASGDPERDAQGRCIACGIDESGEAIARIGGDASDPPGRFEGYTDEPASRGKVLHGVFEAGDAWYRSGDLMRRDRAGFYYFVDRIGDTFRWKGENVSTTEVAAALCAAPGVAEAVVYGVAVPDSDGRAGMAALLVTAGFDLDVLWRHAQAALPRYARPLFVRLLSDVERTGTFKPAKSALIREGFDPSAAGDPLYVADAASGCYRTLDAALHARLLRGQWRLD
jgi:fatty-acyl-CoA synthase